MTTHQSRILSPLAAYATAACTAIINPTLWPLSIAITILASINLYTALTTKKATK